VATQLDLPEQFRRRIIAIGGREWAQWLDSLPELVATLADQWGLDLRETFPLTHSYVVAAEREGTAELVLKIGPPVEPGGEGTVREALALRLAGPSAVRVVDEDHEAGAILLERATPGTPLSSMWRSDDDAATEILGSAMQDFWQPADVTCGLPPLSDLEDTFEEFDRGPHGASALPKDLVGQLADITSGLRDLRAAATTARRVFQELLADRAPSVLLHGDLHHDNTLADEARRWVVIDPKGFVGDRAYDATAMLYNPLPGFSEVSDPDPVLHRRLAILSHVLGVDRERLAAWGYVKAVLSMLWALEDGGQLDGTDVRLRVIAALRRLI